MNARKRGTFSDCQEHYYRLATKLVADSICVMCIAMNEELGIGKGRMNRIVDRYRKINSTLNDYQDDARFEAEIRTRMSQIGLQEFADAIMSTHDIKRYRQEVKRMNTVSIKEATEAQEKLKVMMELMKK